MGRYVTDQLSSLFRQHELLSFPQLLLLCTQLLLPMLLLLLLLLSLSLSTAFKL
jgi:hypothetical protein